MRNGSESSSTEFEWVNGALWLEDGTRIPGRLFGAAKSVVGELVFQTGMVGYVEVCAIASKKFRSKFLRKY